MWIIIEYDKHVYGFFLYAVEKLPVLFSFFFFLVNSYKILQYFKIHPILYMSCIILF
jgi:hypothetical protein